MDQTTERLKTYVERRDTTDARDGMVIDWDVAIPMDDGLILRADIYRPPVEGKSCSTVHSTRTRHDPQDRPPAIFGGTTTIYFAPGRDNYVMLPVIPPKQ